LYLILDKKNKMIRRAFFVIGLLAVLPFLGCEEETDLDTMRAEEDRYFNLYMIFNYPYLDPRESGLYYIEDLEGTGASPDTGDYVLINYLAYTIPDEDVVDTYTKEWAQNYGIYNSEILYGPFKFKHGTEIEGMKEGLSMMKEGGISRLIFKSELGYGENGFGDVGQFESLMYDIELVEVITDPAAREQEQIDSFLAEHVTAYPITDKGTGAKMYYIPGVAGDSVQVAEGSVVEVYYTGQLLDGRIFDSNEGSSTGLEVTIGEGGVIPGWELGLKYFRYGGTGQLLIPHQLAYGEDGAKTEQTEKTTIPPFEALLFDIEIIKPLGLVDPE
jgi:FKBP-type peptidyl-prolyl cis-trans isomerase FkpA